MVGGSGRIIAADGRHAVMVARCSQIHRPARLASLACTWRVLATRSAQSTSQPPVWRSPRTRGRACDVFLLKASDDAITIPRSLHRHRRAFVSRQPPTTNNNNHNNKHINNNKKTTRPTIHNRTQNIHNTNTKTHTKRTPNEHKPRTNPTQTEYKPNTHQTHTHTQNKPT